MFYSSPETWNHVTQIQLCDWSSRFVDILEMSGANFSRNFVKARKTACPCAESCADFAHPKHVAPAAGRDRRRTSASSKSTTAPKHCV